MCAVAIGVGVVSCKKEQAVETPTVKLDETIPSDDEAIAKELFAMQSEFTKNNKANDKIKDEVEKTPKEINKAIFLIEAYLNYEYDDSTKFELTSIDTSYITIPASLVNNNKYQVDYAAFIEAYNHSEIETISHQERQKLKLTEPTVVVIDIELVTPESPVLATKDFVTRVITVMGYQQASCFPYISTNCNNFATDAAWAFDTQSGTNGFCDGLGECNTSNARIELERKANLCNTYVCPQSFFSDVNIVVGNPFNYLIIGGFGADFCLNSTKLNNIKTQIYSNSLYNRPPNKQIRATSVAALSNTCICPDPLAYQLTVTFAKCTSKRLIKKIYSEN